MSEKVKPTLPGGTRDYLPSEMIFRDRIFETIRRVYEQFGFDPLDTPALERTEVLTGNNKDFSMIIYNAKTSRQTTAEEEHETSLRFDLTVPLARVIAAYPELNKPFKRYQVGKVWRGEKPQAGRYREFVQFDADIVGSSSMLADTEIINLMYETLKAIGIKNFLIRFNNRKVLNGLADYAGFAGTKVNAVLRVLDKLDKTGLEQVKEELKRPPDNEYDDTALNLSDETVSKIINFLDIKGSTDEILAKLKEIFVDGTIGSEGTEELSDIVVNLRTLKIPEEKWKVDISIARGLDYYTGPVFETTLLDLPEFGSVFSGGRFDGLVGRFSETSIPATGASIGVDRLFAAMEKLDLLTSQKTVVKVLVTTLDKNLEKEYVQITQELRQAGLETAIYLGTETAFKAQLAFAVKQEIPVLIILGEEEFQKGTIQVKDMKARTQKQVPRSEYLEAVKDVLKK